MPAEHFTIVVVEDNPADVETLRIAFELAEFEPTIVAFDYGSDALKYLGANGYGFSEPRACDLVILDLNLPRMSGFEVLERIRGTQHLRSLPIIVMSGSQRLDEIKECYRLGASSCITKPSHLPEITAVGTRIVGYLRETRVKRGEA